MAIRQPKTLFDLRHGRANLRVTCPACGRSALFSATQIADYWHARGWNGDLGAVGMRFRCGDAITRKGCGHRGCSVDIAPIPISEILLPPSPLQTKDGWRRRRIETMRFSP